MLCVLQILSQLLHSVFWVTGNLGLSNRNMSHVQLTASPAVILKFDPVCDRSAPKHSAGVSRAGITVMHLPEGPLCLLLDLEQRAAQILPADQGPKRSLSYFQLFCIFQFISLESEF